MSDLEEKYNSFMELYNELKQEIRTRDKGQFERWKAGGYIVDDDIISMYPNIVTILESMIEQEHFDSIADSREEWDESDEMENDKDSL